MPEYVFHYRQTEYRRAAIFADNPEEALDKFREGGYADDFMSTADDQCVLTVDERQDDENFLCLFDHLITFDEMTDPEGALAMYAALRAHHLCDEVLP